MDTVGQVWAGYWRFSLLTDFARALRLEVNRKELETRMTESKKNKSWRQALELMMKQQRQLPEPDYSLPAFNDPARLREWMNVLGINQSDLAREADVSQSFISALERGAEKFSEPSRTKIWRAINKLQLDQVEQDLRKKADEGCFDSDDAGIGFSFGIFERFGFFKTPMEQKDEEIQLLKQERDHYKKSAELYKQIADMPLLDRVAELERRVKELEAANTDFHRLFALKGSAVAGDELQEQIEARQRVKPSSEQDK